MKKNFTITCLVLFTCLLSLEGFAGVVPPQEGNGCRVPSGTFVGRVYQNPKGFIGSTQSFYATDYYMDPSNCAMIISTIPFGCYYESPANSNTYQRGDLVQVSLTPITCNIDDYVYILGMSLLCLGAYRLHKHYNQPKK